MPDEMTGLVATGLLVGGSLAAVVAVLSSAAWMSGMAGVGYLCDGRAWGLDPSR